MNNYKAVFIPCLGMANLYSEEFQTEEAARTALALIASYTLFLHDAGLMEDYSNTGDILKRNSEGVWEVIDDDE